MNSCGQPRREGPREGGTERGRDEGREGGRDAERKGGEMVEFVGFKRRVSTHSGSVFHSRAEQ